MSDTPRRLTPPGNAAANWGWLQDGLLRYGGCQITRCADGVVGYLWSPPADTAKLERELATALSRPCPHVVTDGTTSHCSLAEAEVAKVKAAPPAVPEGYVLAGGSTFDEWWADNGEQYYVSNPPPGKGGVIDIARDSWNAALAMLAAAKGGR
jgi:hypothetical protein